MPETKRITTRLLRAGVLRLQHAASASQLEDSATDERQFALELLRRGWVTHFQARWIARGNTDLLAVGKYVLLGDTDLNWQTLTDVPE